METNSSCLATKISSQSHSHLHFLGFTLTPPRCCNFLQIVTTFNIYLATKTQFSTNLLADICVLFVHFNCLTQLGYWQPRSHLPAHIQVYFWFPHICVFVVQYSNCLTQSSFWYPRSLPFPSLLSFPSITYSNVLCFPHIDLFCEITCFSYYVKKSHPHLPRVWPVKVGMGLAQINTDILTCASFCMVTMDPPISLKFVTEISTSLIWVLFQIVTIPYVSKCTS